LALPVADLHTNAAEYVAAQTTAPPIRDPPYLDAPSFETVLGENIHERNGRVDHHGVSYDSFEQLTLSELYYPVTNGVGFDLCSSLQILPTRNPFLDRRLIDLHLSMPLKYRLRHEPVHRAIGVLDPSLAAIPHATTRMPVEYPWAMHVAGELGTDFLAKFGHTEPSQYPQGPWQDKNEAIRQQDFVGDALERNESNIRRLPFLSWEAVRETYRSHLAGENHGQELYRLLTVLEMPLTRRIVESRPTVTTL
jgi:asparagine synthase (glutamine-hydrolysing)